MTAVLVTGMSGVGKSTVASALKALGHRAIDTDSEAFRVTPEGEWLFDEPTIEAALDAADDSLVFVVGAASNQVRFYHRFDIVVLLSAPTDTMIERIRLRTDNPFGKSDAEREKILADTRVVQPMLRRRADVEIHTDRPVDEVVAMILDAVTPG